MRAGDVEDDFPQIRTILNPLDTAARTVRVYQRTYLETVDFDLSVATPQLIKSQWNISPNVSISNVDPGAYFVRSERTGATWVSQSKRLSYGLSIAPTFYGLFDGFGRSRSGATRSAVVLVLRILARGGGERAVSRGDGPIADRVPWRSGAEAGDAGALDQHRGEAETRR